MKIKKLIVKHEYLLLALSTGLFLGVVLFIYQGYNIDQGISSSGHNLLFRSLSFALLTSAIFYTSEIGLEQLHVRINLFWRRLLQIGLGTTVVFFLYNYFWQWNDLYFQSYLKLLAEFTGVMIIPIVFHFLIYKNKLIDNQSPEMLKISSANGKQVVSLRKHDFLMAKAEDNYVKLFYIKNGDMEQLLLRATLSHIVNQINQPEVLQCHRSFVVNRENIVHQEKKNNKLLLTIQGYPLPVPVSPKYQQQFVFE